MAFDQLRRHGARELSKLPNKTLTCCMYKPKAWFAHVMPALWYETVGASRSLSLSDTVLHRHRIFHLHFPVVLFRRCQDEGSLSNICSARASHFLFGKASPCDQCAFQKSYSECSSLLASSTHLKLLGNIDMQLSTI